MLLQTNAYFVPSEKRTEHARLLQRFRHCLARLGCDLFECYEQTGTNWTSDESKNRFIQIMRFRDRKHQLQVQTAERTDPTAQALIKEFCELINFPYQQQQGYFAVGFYTSVLPGGASRQNQPGEAATPPSDAGQGDETLPSLSASDVAIADFGDPLELEPIDPEPSPNHPKSADSKPN
ncbi:MAG TPA: hypothetical protein VHS31_00610 [Tepidisphaeraceae bacterium]|jgi:hypothetical protein|nr:hypothetical protein [Tepidisphaeraceae bacterium]